MPLIHENRPAEAHLATIPRQRRVPKIFPPPSATAHPPVAPAPSKKEEFVDLISMVIVTPSSSSSTSSTTSSTTSSSSSYKITTPISNPDVELHFAKLRVILTYWAEMSIDSRDEAHDLGRTIGGILRPLLQGLGEDVPVVVAELVAEICEQSLKEEGEPYWDELLDTGNVFVARAEANTMDIWTTTSPVTQVLSPAEQWAQDQNHRIDTLHRENMILAEQRAWSERSRVQTFEKSLIKTLRGDDSDTHRSLKPIHAFDLGEEPWWQASDAGIMYEDRKLQWWKREERKFAWQNSGRPWPMMILKNERVKFQPVSGW